MRQKWGHANKYILELATLPYLNQSQILTNLIGIIFGQELEFQPLCSMGMGVILALCPATAWRKMDFCGICQATLKVIKNNQQQVLNQLFNSISSRNDLTRFCEGKLKVAKNHLIAKINKWGLKANPN